MTPKDFSTLLSDMTTAAQARASAALDFAVGSVLRAVSEAFVGVVLWLQSLAFQILQIIRASTATGSDLDTWMADFGFVRIAATSAAGTVTFARYTTGQAATIPVGTVVQTADGSQKYAVVADATNSAYNSGTNTYTIGPSTASLNVAVVAQTAGAAGNVGAGLVNLLSQAIPYVDTVTNAAAMSGGADAESDTAFRARFVLHINSLAEATEAAIIGAIQSVSAALTYKLFENQDTSGASRPGYFYAVIDDGSGATPAPTIAAVATAIDAVRGFTVAAGVIAATKLTANATIVVSVASGYTGSSVYAAVQAAVTTLINALPVGATLSYSQFVATIAAVPGVQGVTSATINGFAADLVAAGTQAIRAGTIGVSS